MQRSLKQNGPDAASQLMFAPVVSLRTSHSNLNQSAKMFDCGSSVRAQVMATALSPQMIIQVIVPIYLKRVAKFLPHMKPSGTKWCWCVLCRR